jgi:RecB family exonuclease
METDGGLASVEDLRRAAVEAGADGPRPAAWIRPILAAVSARPPRDDRGWDRVVGIVEAALGLDALVDRLGGLRSAPDVPEVVRLFRELLDSVGLGPPDEVEPAGPDAEALAVAEAEAAAALDTLHALVDSMEVDLEAVRSAVPGAGSPAPLELFREALERALDDAFVRPPRDRGGVQIVGLLDLHGVDVPWLWVGGLVEEAFPRAPRPSFLLPPGARKGMPSSDRGEEDRAVFASLLRNAGHGARLTSAVLILSHPSTTDGADSVPSTVVQDLVALRVGDGTLGEWFEARQREEEDALPKILGPRELLARPRDAERMPAAMRPEVAAEVRRQRALAAARRDPSGFGRWDGVVGLGRPHRSASVGWVRDLLGVDTHRGRPRLVASASGLERWASCSIRWFFEQVLTAEEPREYEAEPSPAEQGSLLHAALECLLSERIEAVARGEAATAAVSDLDAAGLAALKRRARVLVREAAPRVVPERPGPWVERALRELEAGLDPDDPTVEPWDGPLATFLNEAATPFLDLDPKAVEWRFQGLDPAEEATRVDGAAPRSEGVRVALRGSIDRVDVARSSGPGLGGASLAVFDYKSGRLSAPAERVNRGLLLQPVVYAAAARRLSPGVGVQGLVTGYLEVREGLDSGRRFFLGDEDVLQALRDSDRAGKALGVTSRPVSPAVWAAWLRRADLYGRWIADGVFPPTLAGPVHARCDRCPYRRACRVDHLRNADLARRAEGLALLPAPVAVSDPEPA